ncbi:hypothetical protein [Albimonas pacifica]|uniref:Uncharacterized protein n=1 Tax=Albimonas pacifica TaxID=1114924 RepID=A0A1I3JJ79_9RHOB|nr:hypothetical protein [Albimonas pacifica]SFI60196.1 hypothetical protein SAMN05216258_10827 [Albimonas pacifica]
MTDAPRSPIIAFGLHAAARAMAAKLRPLTEDEAAELRQRLDWFLPDRADLTEALEAFLAEVGPEADVDDAARQTAADAFLAQLAALEDGLTIAEAQARRIAGAMDQIEFDWQQRADLR